MKRLFIFPALITCLYACHTTKKITKTTTPVAPIDTVVVAPPSTEVPSLTPDHRKADSLEFIKSTYRKILANHIGFTTFSAKIDFDYEDGEGNDHNANAHVRMYKDSVIWISVTGALGIEGLRLYISRDSVKVLDKQNKVYTAKSISYLQELTALPLGLSDMQDLLVGNPVFLDSTIISYSRSPNSISLLSRGEFFRNLVTVEEAIFLIQSSKLNDIDEQRNRTCYLTYADYEDKKGVNFSQKRTINVADKKKINIKMDFKQYEFNEKLSFPFSVPKNYTAN